MEAICTLLLCACVYDYRDKRIPNWVILFLLIVVFGITQDWVTALVNMLCVVGLLYFFFKMGALGAGDVKLLGACAGIFPPNKVLIFLFVSLLIAAIFSCIKIIKEQNFKERMWYMYEYFAGVVRNGAWRLYIQNEEECKQNGICLSGPVLCSVLLYIGGAY